VQGIFVQGPRTGELRRLHRGKLSA
jgi:hypothetical protein